MENYNLHRRAQSGWHPTAYSRKPTPDAPRERNYEAILAAAKRPPVGYYEDAPRGIQFGGGGKPNPHGADTRVPTAAPVYSDDLYEPIGTMPVVGDRITHAKYPDDVRNCRVTVLRSRCVQAVNKFGETIQPNLEQFCRGMDMDDPWRILKRQPRKQVEGRVWKGAGAGHYVRIGERMFFKMDAWREYFDIWDAKGQKPTGAFDTGELHGTEADAIIRECAKAMGLCPQKPE